MQRFVLSGLFVTCVCLVLSACGGDEGDDAPSCYDGCESAADPVACVAACQGSPDTDGAGQSDVEDDQDASSSDVDTTSDANQPDDAAVGEDTLPPEDADSVDDTTSQPDAPTDADANEPDVLPIPEAAQHVTCGSLADCYFDREPDSAEAEACLAAAMPSARNDFAPVLDCARTQCSDSLGSGIFPAYGCLEDACPDTLAACTYAPAFYEGCGPVDACLSACDKRDEACRNNCRDSVDPEILAVAVGHYACVDRCYSEAFGQEVCAAVDCADLYDACYGADLGWNCVEMTECTYACPADDIECLNGCVASPSSALAQEAAYSLVNCALSAGCYTGDTELAGICAFEACGAQAAICVRYPDRVP